MSEMTPREIVSELINILSVKPMRKERWRLRCVIVGEECNYKSHFVMKSRQNILMIGPTGVGKRKLPVV